VAGDPGKKNRKISLKSKTITNTGGDAVESLTVFAYAYADFRPVRMDERFASDARHSIRAGNFRIYYRDDITPDMVIGFDGLDWRILGIAEVGYRDELDITAEAVY
jgi:SPP1 family predicted phage head-tail adaptor